MSNMRDEDAEIQGLGGAVLLAIVGAVGAIALVGLKLVFG